MRDISFSFGWKYCSSLPYFITKASAKLRNNTGEASEILGTIAPSNPMIFAGFHLRTERACSQASK